MTWIRELRVKGLRVQDGESTGESHLPGAAAKDVVGVDGDAGALPPALEDVLRGGGDTHRLARHHLRRSH